MTVLLASVVLLCGLLAAKKNKSSLGVWLTKPFLSVAFIVVAVLNTHELDLFHAVMLVGFVCCLLGDVFLIAEDRKMFLAGLIVFLMGHVLYIIAFGHLLTPSISLLVPVILLLVIDGVIYYWVGPHIGTMRLPILAYMLVISCMVVAASGVYMDKDLSANGGVLVIAGAIGFFLSDLFVVRERFVSKSFFNSLVGLSLYYMSQFSLAFSLGYF